MDGWTPNFSWIEPDLAVGGSFPIDRAVALARDHGIGAVVDLRDEACDEPDVLAALGLDFLHLPTPDTMGVDRPNLDAGVAFARLTQAQGRRLLVHCEHGIGRSATLALCILVDRGLQPLDALRRAKDARVAISPSEAQFSAWCDWMSARAPWVEAPAYHDFGVVAYRHLAQSA